MEKNKIVKSFLWASFESYSTQGVAFIVSIFMARILTPADYGVIGIIGVFIAISETFIDSGFTNALIQKKDCNLKDYSTVYYFNIIISLCFFIILYFCAPLIARFYKDEILKGTTRVMALTFVISSFGAIPLTILSKELRFKTKANISLSVSIFSGIIGITLAYLGFGVWALVLQNVLSCTFRVMISIIVVHWKPLLLFSVSSFKNLFGFGSKLLGSSIVYTLFNNIYNLVIGKVFNPVDLGYFTRADGYSRLIPINISGVLSKVLFPILSKAQGNDAELITLHHQFVILTSFFIFPGCLFLAGFASPLVFLLISEKWMPIVPILQILCLAGIFDHFSSINGNFILAKGYSGFFLKMNFITKPIGIIILIISVLFNLIIVSWGKVIYSLVCFITGYFYLRKVLAIKLKMSFLELLKLFLLSGSISLCILLLFKILVYSWLNLITLGLLSIVIYIGLTKLLCPNTYFLLKKLIKSKSI